MTDFAVAPTRPAAAVRATASSTINRLLLVGVLITAAGVVAAIAMQYAKNEPFPPRISISAYGLGANGWVMTLAATLIGLGSVPLMIALRSSPLKVGAAVPVLLTVWTISMVTLGWVHTNPPNTPAGPTALVHQGAAVVAMVAFPCAIAVLIVGRIRRRIARGVDSTILTVLTAASLTCLVLLFFAAFGADTAGLGAHRSWALYQFSAAMLDLVLVFVVSAIVFLDHRPRELAG